MNLKNHITSFLLSLLGTLAVVAFCAAILSLTIRGRMGNPTAKQLNNLSWTDNGPLELSPERGRYALTYSLFEDRSYQFSDDLGQFAAPDVAQYKGRFVSLFAPTVSYIVIPGYMIGKYFGAAQVGTFAMIAFFAVLNVILIRAIAIRLGAKTLAANIAALLYLFATPAFAYANTLYQHHISTFLILLSIYILVRFKTLWSLIVVWFCCALSISVDNPNLFMMFPIGLFALGRFIQVENHLNTWKVKVHFLEVITFVVMIFPLLFFMNFNKQSYGDPFKLSGTVATAVIQNGKVDQKQIVEEELKKESGEKDEDQKSAVGFFKTRNMPRGFYQHFISPDRGMLFFTPIMFVGVVGLFTFKKKNSSFMQLMLAVIGANVLLYSMWGDPYGGWAFGSRYLIPTYAMLSIFLALALSKYRRNFFFLIPTILLAVFSVYVNTVGALTSSRNPPQVEILALEALTHRQERYSFDRNMEMLDRNQSKSFAFQETVLSERLTAWQYAWIIIGSISAILGIQLVLLILQKETAQS